MSDSFKLRLDGENEIEAFLAKLYKRTHDLRPLMDMIGAQLESSTADNFDGEHDPYGIPWPKSQRAKATGGKTLTDTRRLAGSIGRLATATSVEVGTNVVYARRHNQGWSGTERVGAHQRVMTQVFGVPLSEPKTVNVRAFNRRANTPKRQFLGIGPDDEGDIMAMMESYFGFGDPPT